MPTGAVQSRIRPVLCLSLACALLAAVPCAWSAAPPAYRYELLGSDTRVAGINELGQAAGTNGYGYAILWDGATLVDPGLYGEGMAVNDHGLLVGTAWQWDRNLYRVVTYANGQRGIIEQTLGGRSAWARSVNNSGTIVGRSETANAAVHAFAYANGRMTDLGTLDDAAPDAPGSHYSSANDINDAGQIVGTATRADSPYLHAFLYEHGRMRDLGALGGSTEANAINDLGQVVGHVRLAGSDVQHAFLYDHGVVRDLGALPGGYISTALDINNHGVIVGTGYVANLAPRALLYVDGTMYDLNDLSTPRPNIPYFSIEAAYGINEHGQIAAVGCSDHGCTGILLTPVPEPPPAALMLAGIGTCIASSGWRRRPRRAPGARPAAGTA